jgi:hypothetical protein
MEQNGMEWNGMEMIRWIICQINRASKYSFEVNGAPWHGEEASFAALPRSFKVHLGHLVCLRLRKRTIRINNPSQLPLPLQLNRQVGIPMTKSISVIWNP